MIICNNTWEMEPGEKQNRYRQMCNLENRANEKNTKFQNKL